MKKDYISNTKNGVYGGLVLFLVGFLQSLFPFFEITAEVYYVVIWSSYLGNVLITVYFLLRKHSTMLDIFIKTVAILTSYICAFIIGAQSGLMRFLYQQVSVSSKLSANNVSGLIWVISFITVVFICVATLSIKVLFYGIVKLCNTRRRGNGLREP